MAHRDIVKCCDCGYDVVLLFCLAMERYKVVSVGACTHCSDGRTIRATTSVTKGIWASAVTSGLAVIRYGKSD